MKKLLILLVMVLIMAAFFASGLHHHLSLVGIKTGLVQWQGWRDAHPLAAPTAFFVVYVLVAALSLPGAAVMGLAAGAMFGLGQGTLVVSFASSVGAALAFLVARYLLRDWVRDRFGSRLKAIDEGMARDGAFYLFSLRLVPVFPFFLINLLLGLTGMRVWTFYWVSQIGMLAGTLVYVNAGTQLARLDSLSGIFSPALWLSFAALGLFPWLARALIGYRQTRRLYARWKRPAGFDRNLIVIGAGAAGLVTAYIAATVKARVTLVEARKMGGDCLNYGCMPSKALIKSARVAHLLRHAGDYGLVAGEPTFSFPQVMNRVHEVIHRVAPHDSIERYTGLGVEVMQGYARIKDPWTVEIERSDGGATSLTTRSIVIAAGARPFVPALPGLTEVGYVTSDTVWEEFAGLDTPPARLLVLGGGPVGCELAQSFARLGAEVTQIEMAERLLLREDAEVSELVRSSLETDGVRVLTGQKALRCEREDDQKFIVVAGADGEQRIAFDALLCATGRVARLQGYGLEELGVATEHTVITNAYLETLYPNIYAAGDVAGPYQFTHIAAHQAWYAAVNALFGRFRKFKVDYSVIPWTTFVDPEVAHVGLNEQDARQKGIAYEVTRYGLADLDRAIADSAAHGFVKVLTEPGKDQILGVTIVGEHAGDLLAEFVLAMKHGLGLNKILGAIHSYPTWAEANKCAAGEWKRNHAPQRMLAWLERYHGWMRGGAA